MQRLYKFLCLYLLAVLGQNVHGSEIINGEIAPLNSMKYMASVQNMDGHFCGGFLISKDFVLTAAHCDCLNPIRLVLGTHKLQKPNKKNIRYIERTYKPKNYVGKGHDIMLLKLSQKAQLDDNVQTIEFSTPKRNIKANEKCTVAGWGSTVSSGHSVDDLRVVNVSIIDQRVCKNQWGHGLPTNVICAGGYNTDKGFCQGDYGGPLVCNGVAVGIVSFNRNLNCSYPDVPNVYTDISKYLPWIDKILKE